MVMVTVMVVMVVAWAVAALVAAKVAVAPAVAVALAVLVAEGVTADMQVIAVDATCLHLSHARFEVYAWHAPHGGWFMLTVCCRWPRADRCLQGEPRRISGNI